MKEIAQCLLLSLLYVSEQAMNMKRYSLLSSCEQLIEEVGAGYSQLSHASQLAPNSSIPGDTIQEKLPLFFNIVNHSSNVVVITNSKKDIIYVNKKFEELSGYALEEVLGKNPRVLKSEKTPLGTYRDMHRTLQAGSVWEGVFVNTHKDGSEYVEEAVITPVANTTGDAIFYVAEKKNITAQKNAEDAVLKLTHFDSLTELPNRAYFLDKATKLASFPSTDEYSFAILFADLDRFKELNDTSGHLVGDMALKEMSRRIEKILLPGDFCARVGGDEFVVVHRQATKESTATLASRLVTTLCQPIMTEEHEVYLGISVGSAIWPRNGKALSDVLSCADLAMYEAKLTGQDVVSYETHIGARYHREIELTRRLNQAVNNDQFHLVYQPKFALVTGDLVGLEALLRWNDPDLGSVSPAEFIPVAEKHNMMCSIGKWVIEQACTQFHQWHLEGLRWQGKLSINISVQQIEHPDFYDCVTKTVAENGLSPTMIEFEVTESVLMSDPTKVRKVLKRLTKRGFCISIDDFGTGFSSLSYLSKINASVLKIDKSFIDNIATNVNDKAIVKSVVELAGNLGLTVVAEGVETEEQVHHLLEVGCNIAQGFYYSKPVPADEFSQMVMSR